MCVAKLEKSKGRSKPHNIIVCVLFFDKRDFWHYKALHFLNVVLYDLLRNNT